MDVVRRIAIAMVLVLGLALPIMAEAAPMDVVVKVKQTGFFNQAGKALTKGLKVPKGTVVRMTFVFDEDMTSLAYGDTHQIAITGDEGWTKESQKIWMFNKQAQVTFHAGKEGAQYRVYCILDCIGMEHLNNLVIRVV